MIFEAIVITLLLVLVSFVSCIFFTVCFPNAAERLDRKVAREMERRQDAIDEGIHNIMSYEVNGMTGFEADDM